MSWSTWRKQIEMARSFLTSDKLKDMPVQFIVETQLLLRPYLVGRRKMHLLYKICRADNPDALHADFRAAVTAEERSFDEFQGDAQVTLMAETGDINEQRKELKGGTLLWNAAEQGHIKVARDLLQNPNIDPNKSRKETSTTPLYIAAYRGHTEVVKSLIGHPETELNLGKADTGMSPLIAAAQEGREEVVNVLLKCNGIDVNHATANEGVTALCKACQHGHDHIVDVLLRVPSINVGHALKDGTTALSIAARQGRVKIIEAIAARMQVGGSNAAVTFPKRGRLDSGLLYREAVLSWAEGVRNGDETSSIRVA